MGVFLVSHTPFCHPDRSGLELTMAGLTSSESTYPNANKEPSKRSGGIPLSC